MQNANEICLTATDYTGNSLTREIENLTHGLVAMNTHFEWTIMGKTRKSPNMNEVLMSLHVSDLKICDLW